MNLFTKSFTRSMNGNITEVKFFGEFIRYFHSNDYIRLCFDAFFGLGLFYKYGNYFKNDGRRMLEFTTLIYRRLSWLWFLDIHAVLFLQLKPRLKPRIIPMPDRRWSRMGQVKYMWLWFGFIHRVPKFVNAWLIRCEDRRWEKEQQEMENDPNNPYNDPAYEAYCREQDEIENKPYRRLS